MYTYGRFMLRFDRKQQNSVKQLSFNKKINKLRYESFLDIVLLTDYRLQIKKKQTTGCCKHNFYMHWGNKKNCDSLFCGEPNPKIPLGSAWMDYYI